MFQKISEKKEIKINKKNLVEFFGLMLEQEKNYQAKQIEI